jgi:transcription elongation factor Elf1
MSVNPQTPNPLSALRRIATRPPPDPELQTCDMCAEPITSDHPHVVDIQSRQLMCTCRGCGLLFTADANQRFRAIPDRYLSFPNFELSEAGWESLDIPVGLAFFFSSSVLDRVVAFYPGPAGVNESELGLAAWTEVLEVNPELGVLSDDVEALLVRAPDHDHEAQCFLVPIDACYELAGRLRTVWRGFDGGQDARAVITEFFASIADRSQAITREASA